jgi:hypothetical protein
MDSITVISPRPTSNSEQVGICATQPSQINGDQTAATAAVPDKEPSINPNAISGEAESENPSRPKGIRFGILFLSILAGDFFIGYVRTQ